MNAQQGDVTTFDNDDSVDDRTPLEEEKEGNINVENGKKEEQNEPVVTEKPEEATTGEAK